MSQPIALALLGNPGAGKSTILNGYAGKPVFKSGISFGSGLTTRLEYHQTDSYLLCDSPGLKDISKSDEAAGQVHQLLAKSNPIKLAFVVTLQHGKVRPQDAEAIDLVLSALKGIEVNDSFGIIINQVSRGVNELLSTNHQAFKRVQRLLLGQRYTSHWCVVATDEQLVDKSNGLLMTSQLKEFLDQLPITKPQHASPHTPKESAMPLKLAPNQWTWVDATVKVKIPEKATFDWASSDRQDRVYRVVGPAAVVLELKWIRCNVELLATSSE